MPMYTYVCPDCNQAKEVIMTMAEVDTMAVLCKCRGVGKATVMSRDFKADLFHTPKDTYSKPIVSNSLAVAPDQIAEHRKQFPDIQMTKEGQPVFDKYSTHEAYLEKTNFKKDPAKIRRRVKKTTTV